jgi:hypothetical protein
MVAKILNNIKELESLCYSGGRDQESRSKFEATAGKPITKMAQGVGPEFKPGYHKKKNF